MIGSDPSLGQYSSAHELNTQPTPPDSLGFTGAWVTHAGGTPSSELNTSSLDYSAGGFSVDRAGGSASVHNRRFGRELSNPFTDASSGTYYISFMMQVENSNGYRAFELHRNDFEDTQRTLQIGVNDGAIPDSANSFFIRINNAPAQYLNLGAFNSQVNFFVLKLDLSTTANGDAVTVWRNPSDFSSEINSVSNGSFSGFNFNFQRMALANFFSGSANSGALSVDEIRLGTTWESVVPFSENLIPEPSSMALFFGGILVLLKLRKHLLAKGQS